MAMKYRIRCCDGDVSKSPNDGDFFWLLLVWRRRIPLQSSNCSNSGVFIDDVCEDGMHDLGGRLVLMLTRGCILAGELVMVAVGVIVVVGVGVISIFEKRQLPVTEVLCWGGWR